MIKTSHLVAALLFASASVAHAAGQPTQPAAQGAASVQKNLDANKSDGKADKGLTTAEKNITAKHGKASKSMNTTGMTERTEHAATPERPMMPMRPGR